MTRPNDPVGALVPHTLEEPILGATSGPLAGKTFMAKDQFAIEGRKVSNGSPAWYEAAAPAAKAASAIETLLGAGASLTGITVCDEFFYSVLGTNIHYGSPKNVQAPHHVTGGSSCGSAAAVAASMCDFALASDTGGSTRVPAAFCGLYGFRPSHGRIASDRMTPMAPSYDTVGVLAREVSLLREISKLLLDADARPARIGRVVVAQDIVVRSEASLDEALWTALDKIKEALPRPELMDVAGEETDNWRDAFRILQGFEIQSTLMPFALAHAASLSPAIRERFEIASHVTEAEAVAAKAVRAHAAEHLSQLIAPGTVMVLPTTPTLPPEHDIPDGASFAWFRARTLESTCLAGHARLPQISIPMGRASDCPAGLSFIGWRGGDEALLDLAVALEPLLAREEAPA
jgi:amidase